MATAGGPATDRRRRWPNAERVICSITGGERVTCFVRHPVTKLREAIRGGTIVKFADCVAPLVIVLLHWFEVVKVAVVNRSTIKVAKKLTLPVESTE
jgi:hypothetical protein